MLSNVIARIRYGYPYQFAYALPIFSLSPFRLYESGQDPNVEKQYFINFEHVILIGKQGKTVEVFYPMFLTKLEESEVQKINEAFFDMLDNKRKETEIRF